MVHESHVGARLYTGALGDGFGQTQRSRTCFRRARAPASLRQRELARRVVVGVVEPNETRVDGRREEQPPAAASVRWNRRIQLAEVDAAFLGAIGANLRFRWCYCAATCNQPQSRSFAMEQEKEDREGNMELLRGSMRVTDFDASDAYEFAMTASDETHNFTAVHLVS